MRPHHRPRTGRRRDGAVRRIRSNVPPAYPGVDVNPVEGQQAADDRRLSPALDTGIAVHSRAARQAANAKRRQRFATVAAIVVVLVLVTGAIGWRYASDRTAATTPLVANASVIPTATAASNSTATAKAAVSPDASATPIFAYYKGVKLHLPVPMSKLTEIGFHQASYPYALHLKTQMKNANLSLAVKNRSTGRDRASQPSGPDAVMTGLVLRMWRSRPGPPDTGADVGALAGTTVLSPVTGTIVRIKPYLLYGKYPDYELHIRPDGTKGLDVVMIHLTGLTCSVGEHVDAGVTKVAKVRKLSDKFFDQLAEYTKSPGDHVHIQVNNANYPGYKGLIGAYDPDKPAASTEASRSADETGASDYSSGD